MRATSLRRTVEPSVLARSTMLPNCSGVRELAVDDDGGGDRLAVACSAGRRCVPDETCAFCARIALLTSAGGQVEADQLGRVDPDAHRALGAEQLGLADAGHALDLGQHVAGQ